MGNEVDWLTNWLKDEAAGVASKSLKLPLVDAEKQNVFIPADMLLDHTNHQDMARFLGFQEVLCHYDMLPGNIMLDLNLEDALLSGKDDGNLDGVTLIDYEYSAFSYRAFDIGNFFCEFAGFDKSIEEAYPDTSIRQAVITAYFDSCSRECQGRGADEKDIEGRIFRYWQGLRNTKSPEADAAMKCIVQEFEKVANQLTLCAHTLWYLWGIVQAEISTVDFDYVEYSRVRLTGYRYHKNQFHSSS